MQAAWTAAALGRIKKIPPLKDFLANPTAKPKQSTWEDMYALGLAWASAAGEVLTPGGSA